MDPGGPGGPGGPAGPGLPMEPGAKGFLRCAANCAICSFGKQGAKNVLQRGLSKYFHAKYNIASYLSEGNFQLLTKNGY